MPRKKSFPDIKDTSLHVVPLSSDEDSSLTHCQNVDTDISDVDSSPKRLQRSGTFTKLENVITVVKETNPNEEKEEASKYCDLQDENVNKTNSSDDNTPNMEDIKSDRNINKNKGETDSNDVDKRPQPISGSVDTNVNKDVNTRDMDIEYKDNPETKVNELFMLGRNLSSPPLADSTDYSEDMRSLSARR